MNFDLLKRIVDETCTGVTSYSLVGSGESLLVSDFKERLTYISKRKLANAVIDLVTNGMFVN